MKKIIERLVSRPILNYKLKAVTQIQLLLYRVCNLTKLIYLNLLKSHSALSTYAASLHRQNTISRTLTEHLISPVFFYSVRIDQSSVFYVQQCPVFKLQYFVKVVFHRSRRCFFLSTSNLNFPPLFRQCIGKYKALSYSVNGEQVCLYIRSFMVLSALYICPRASLKRHL